MVVYCQSTLCGQVFLMVVYCQCALCAQVFLMVVYCQCALCGQVSVSVFTNYLWVCLLQSSSYNLSTNSLSDMHFLKIINVWLSWAFVVWAFVQLWRAGATLVVVCGLLTGGSCCCGTQALGLMGSVVAASGIQNTGSVVAVRGLSCSTAWTGIQPTSPALA